MQHVKRFFGFALMPAFSMLASVALLPLIASRFGPESWVALGVGQSLGAIVGVFVSLAWPIVGGHQVASTPDVAARRAVYRQSVYSRAVVLSVLVPLAAGIMLLVPTPLAPEAVLFMAGTALNGMTASWYFSGTGKPGHLVRNEGVVRLVSYCVALGGIGIGGLGLWWYGAVLILAGFIMLTFNWFSIVGLRLEWSRTEFSESMRMIPNQLNGTFSRIMQSIFYYGSNSIYTVVAPGSLVVFSAADQVKRVAANAMGMVPATFVSWVGSVDGASRGRRQRISIFATLIVSILAIFGWLVAGNAILQYLFAGQVQLTSLENALLIGGIVANLLTYSVELLVMVPKSLTTFVYNANSISAVVGLMAMVVAALYFGVSGGLFVLLFVKAAMLLAYLIRLICLGKTTNDEQKG